VIISWPHGLDGRAVIYPNAGSFEADEELRSILGSALRLSRIRARFNRFRAQWLG
jgi:hypothetical protein